MKVTGAVLAGLVGMVAASAATAAVPAVPCNNCTGAQEEQAALSTPGLGIRFVYDLQGNSIRKFKVYLDSPTNLVLDAVPIEPQPKVDAKVQTPSGTAVRTLWEMSVDPDMLVIFAEMRSLNSDYPNAFSKQFRIDITNLGLTNGDVATRYFDPQRIGWEHPGGESRRFMDRVTDLVGGAAATTSGVDRRLSRLIHGVLKPASGAYIEGGTGGATVGVQFGTIGSEFTVDFCNSDGACTRVRITVTANGVRSEYVESRDKYDVMYPTMNEPAPRRREWGRNGMEYARDMAAFIGSRTGGSYTIDGGTQGCRRVVLACSDAGAQWLCTIYCQQ